MNPTPKPDPGVFRDPDVEAGTGAWHVWVGADSDDLWVRVNPTENLSAKVRMVEPNKACNAPAKAEVRTGANGLKAVKIGRGQRFTRGQAQRIPGDNHKVVKGSKRAAEEELGCVPKCRKCEVLPKTPTCKVKVGGQCFVGETSVRRSGASGFELQALAEVGLGERVETFRASDGSWWEPGGRRLFAASQDRAVWLRQERADGGWTAVGLIRSRIWLEKQGASRAGARVELKLPELGASGLFEVVSVEPCPAICAGGGCVVTGVFCHGAGRVYDLWLEGESGPLGVTSGHPIWSAGRGAWVPAGALQEGECVQGVSGPVRVLRMEERGDAPVFTLEVDGGHCYRVGEQGILVHNSSVHCSPCDDAKIGVQANGTLFDERRYKTETKFAFDERPGKKSKTSGQKIPVEAVKSVFARLRSTDGGSTTGNPEQVWTQCVVGVKTDQAGHVLANSWGGSGKLKDGNLFPVFANANTGRQATFEKKVKDAIGVKDVCVVVLLKYDDDDRDYAARPYEISYVAYIDGVAHRLSYRNEIPDDAHTPAAISGRVNHCRKLKWNEE